MDESIEDQTNFIDALVFLATESISKPELLNTIPFATKDLNRKEAYIIGVRLCNSVGYQRAVELTDKLFKYY